MLLNSALIGLRVFEAAEWFGRGETLHHLTSEFEDAANGKVKSDSDRGLSIQGNYSQPWCNSAWAIMGASDALQKGQQPSVEIERVFGIESIHMLTAAYKSLEKRKKLHLTCDDMLFRAAANRE